MFARRPQPVAESQWFLPRPRHGDADLIGFGADLEPATLVHAYRNGVFPWPHEGVALPWFSPDPRALLFPDAIHVSRSLRARMRRCSWATTVNEAFGEVVAACAQRPGEGTWITAEMADAYIRLYKLGWAHSLEVWDGDRLVGGIYGVAVGGCFTGESMFHRETDASKVALVELSRRWDEGGGHFIDVQLPTPHLETMGAVTMTRGEFLPLIEAVRDIDTSLSLDRRPVNDQ